MCQNYSRGTWPLTAKDVKEGTEKEQCVDASHLPATLHTGFPWTSSVGSQWAGGRLLILRKNRRKEGLAVEATETEPKRRIRKTWSNEKTQRNFKENPFTVDDIAEIQVFYLTSVSFLKCFKVLVSKIVFYMNGNFNSLSFLNDHIKWEN